MDISKNVFEVCVQDERGQVVGRQRLSRGSVLPWFSRQTRLVVGMEAWGGRSLLGARVEALGHEVKILPPQYVKPYVRTNKNDAQDAQGICRALREPDIPGVAIADRQQQDIQVLDRMRERLVAGRTALVNQMRGFLLEYGVAIPVGVKRGVSRVREILESRPEQLSREFLEVLQDQYSECLEGVRRRLTVRGWELQMTRGQSRELPPAPSL